MPTGAGVETGDELTSGYLERRYGVSPRTLRYYEQHGLLTPRRIGDVRLFSSKDLIRLELILKGKKIGLSLDEIHSLIQSHRVEPKNAAADTSAIDDFVSMQRQLSLLEAQKAGLEAAIGELNARLTGRTFLVDEK